MKKLALVLGSLLVVGTAATAKEVVPAPVVMPEKVVEVVEKPVIVYRDREVAPAWRPSGSVDVHLRNWGKIENQSSSPRGNRGAGWKGAEEWTQLRTTTKINFTPNQSLEIATRHKYGLDDKNNDMSEHQRIQLTHFYNFGNLGSSKVNAKWKTQFRHEDDKYLEGGLLLDFSEYFFKNDYVKATALEIMPFYRYDWDKNEDYVNNFGLYANAEFDLPWGMTFQAEFDDLYTYSQINRGKGGKKDAKAQTGTVELTLAKEFELYKAGKHTLGFETELVYATDWSYSKKVESIGYDNGFHGVNVGADGNSGTIRRGNGKKERWGGYSAKVDPHFNYTFQATDFVKLYARVGAEYKNREEYRHGAKYWRWQPYARLGFKATF